MEITGELDSAKLEAGLKETLNQLSTIFDEGSIEELNNLFFEKNAPNVPLLTGLLRMGNQLGDNVHVMITGETILIQMEYAAYNDRTGYNYAGIQELNPEYNHPRGGNYQYVERGLELTSDEIFRIIIERLTTILQENI